MYEGKFQRLQTRRSPDDPADRTAHLDAPTGPAVERGLRHSNSGAEQRLSSPARPTVGQADENTSPGTRHAEHTHHRHPTALEHRYPPLASPQGQDSESVGRPERRRPGAPCGLRGLPGPAPPAAELRPLPRQQRRGRRPGRPGGGFQGDAGLARAPRPGLHLRTPTRRRFQRGEPSADHLAPLSREAALLSLLADSAFTVLTYMLRETARAHQAVRVCATGSVRAGDQARPLWPAP